MTRIVVAAKADRTLLQDTQLKDVILSKPSIIQVGVTKADVASLVKDGNNLVITLKTGEKIVLNNFFTEKGHTDNSLAFPEKDGSFSVAHFTESGKFTNYSGLKQLDSLLDEGANAASPVALNAYSSPSPTVDQGATSEDSDFSFSSLISSSAVKAGLSLASAVGLGLLLLDGNSSSSTPSKNLNPPDVPTANLSEDGTTISGKGTAGSTVYIVDDSEKVVAKVKVDSSGNYSVKLPEPLVNGNKLYINAKDSAGNASKYTMVTGTKDTIPPDEPQAQLSDDGRFLTGKTEGNAKVFVYDAQGQVIASAVANASGDFTITLTPPLTSTDGGTVVAEDAAGNKSVAHKIIAGHDTIAPDQPTKFEVAADGSSIKGSAEANAKVIIKDSKGNVIGSGAVDEHGNFSVSISPAIAKNSKAELIIEDAAGNQSKPKDIQQGDDTLPPEKPTAMIDAVGKVVTGTAEANSIVTVKSLDGKTVLGSATADANGHYTITLDKALTDSVKVNVTSTDKKGNVSDVQVLEGSDIDTIPPTAPTITNVLDTVGLVQGNVGSGNSTDDYRPTFSGKGEAGATLTIYDNGKAIGAVTVNENGTWSFTPDKDLALGDHSFTAIQSDKAGNTSPYSATYKITVVEQTGATLESPQSQLSDDGTVVTGKTIPNAKVNVYDPDGNIVGSAVANSNGEFTIQVNPALVDGKVGQVIATDSYGNQSAPHEVIAGKDTVAPDPAKFQIAQDGQTVTGKAEVNTKVLIIDDKGNTIGSGIVGSNGKFTVTLDTKLTEDQIVHVVVEDAAGNQSKPSNLQLGTDTLPPEPAAATINADGNVVTGTAEANAKVVVYDTSNNIIGSAVADADGKYTISLSKAITDNKIANVFVFDAANNKSDVTSVTGTKDTIAPNKPYISFVMDDFGDEKGQIQSGGSTDDKRPAFTGTGEANATLTIYDNGNYVGAITVKADGTWSYAPSNDLGLGLHNFTFTLTDKAGNTSIKSDPFVFTVIEPKVTSTVMSVDQANDVHLQENTHLLDSTDHQTTALVQSMAKASPTSFSLQSLLDQSNLDHTDLHAPVDNNTHDLSSIHDLLSQPTTTDSSSIDHAIQTAISSDSSAVNGASLTHTGSDVASSTQNSVYDILSNYQTPQVDSLHDLLNQNYALA